MTSSICINFVVPYHDMPLYIAMSVTLRNKTVGSRLEARHALPAGCGDLLSVDVVHRDFAPACCITADENDARGGRQTYARQQKPQKKEMCEVICLESHAVNRGFARRTRRTHLIRKLKAVCCLLILGDRHTAIADEVVDLLILQGLRLPTMSEIFRTLQRR